MPKFSVVRGVAPRTKITCRIVTLKLTNGTLVKFRAYPLTVLAQILGRRPHTLRIWEAKGVIPGPLTRLSKGEQRYYLEPEIRVYKQVFDECKLSSGVSFETLGFPKKLRSALRELQHSIQSGEVEGAEIGDMEAYVDCED